MTIGALIIQRIIVPISLVLCILYRPVALSIPHLVLSLYTPFVPIATTKTICVHTGYYFKAAIAISAVNVAIQFGFQFVLLSESKHLLESCSFLEILFRHIGVIRFENLTFASIALWILPDIVLLTSTIIAYTILKKLTSSPAVEDVEDAIGGLSGANKPDEEMEVDISQEKIIILKRCAIVCAMTSLLVAATLQPSVPSAVYFIVFLLTITAWATYKNIERHFAIICRVIAVIFVVHFCAFLTYQTPWLQNQFDANNRTIRLLGFNPLMISTCNETESYPGGIRMLHINRPLELGVFLNPIALFVCYYVLVISSNFILNAKIHRNIKRDDPIEKIAIDSNGTPATKEEQLIISEYLWMIVRYLTDKICDYSYVISNCAMMVWSIVFHSWLGFVFLIVANLLWIIPNQRKNMHRISPFVVIYAEFLLISQYLYCMNFTEDELPSHVDTKGVNLAQIGFIRYRTYPCVPLLLKTLFTLTFWLTLRQTKYEASVQFPSTAELGFGDATQKSKLIFESVNVLKTILMEVWIWIVVFALFFFAMYGESMTVFRILHMALFLTFMITFQISWKIWKSIMYTFWIIVIGFSMFNLVTIYIFQFDEFDELLMGLGIGGHLQKSLGLEKYATSGLFLRLFFPTLFVVITVVQLQVFHKKYLERLEFPSISSHRENSILYKQSQSSVDYIHLGPESPTGESQRIDISDSKSIATEIVQGFGYSHQCNFTELGRYNSTNEYSNSLQRFHFPNHRIFSQYLSGYIVYIVALSAFNLLLIHQHRNRFLSGDAISRPKILFPEITRDDADKNISHLVKYLLNFAFYKFGIEVTLIMLVFSVSTRMDIIAVLYAIWLCVLIGASRNTRRHIWPIFQSFIIISIVLQYILTVGLPPYSCIDSLWQNILEMWLPRSRLHENSHKLIVDFLLLMCACRQMLVFRIEKRFENAEFPGGSNRSTVDKISEDKMREIPIETNDFVSVQKNWLDILKCIVFLGCFWASLAIVFLAGSRNINIYSIGYLIGSFIFLWQGAEFYLRPIQNILRCWKLLIAYNVFVITAKVCLHLPVCFFFEQLRSQKEFYLFSKVFGISCPDEKFSIIGADMPPNTGNVCHYSQESTSLLWDFVCFMFLIAQLRIFQSYYFCHVINESKASSMLSSRGAELIECLHAKQVKLQVQHEEEILHKVKRKMDRIKANQRTIQPTMTVPKTHYDATRCGDYYLFENFNERVRIDLLPRQSSVGIDDAITDRKLGDKLTIEQILSKSFQTSSSSSKPTRLTEAPLETTSLSTINISDSISFGKTKNRSDDSVCGVRRSSESDSFPGPSTLPETKETAVSSSFNFITAFTSGILVSMALYLYKFSRSYRHVTRILSKEKKALKQNVGFCRGHCIGSACVWLPQASALQSLSLAASTGVYSTGQSSSSQSYYSAQESPTSSRKKITDQARNDQMKGESRKSSVEGDDDFYMQPHLVLIEFLQSLWFAFISNTDYVCYLFVFINMVVSQSVLALPMPLMVFLWGSLIVPRPAKTFWICLIAYTEIVVLSKYIAPLLLWLEKSPNPIGIEFEPNYATWDLLLLFAIFFHRFVQKRMGIWEYQYTSLQAKSADTTKTATVNERNTDSNRDFAFPELDANNCQNYFSSASKSLETKQSSSLLKFYQNLLNPANRLSADVYKYIFLCDFINFFVLLFGFTAFGSRQGVDEGVTSYVQENRIPFAFLFMLLLQFVFMIVDRALYLRKNLLGKIIFQIVSVVGMHIWLFFLVPKFSEQSFNAQLPPVMYYGFKYLYFLLSAYQIRCGYPKRILGNFITTGFTIFNLIAFKIYMLTPFLFELRTLMDWIWTDTTMPLFEWLKMEDIFTNIFELKCLRQIEKDFPAPRGQSKRLFIKYLMGGGFLIAIIGLVWGPLALFSFQNAVGESNNPYEVRISLRIAPYEPLFRMDVQHSQIHSFNDNTFAKLKSLYAKDRAAITFLSKYEANDVAAVVLRIQSTVLWIISPPDQKRLTFDLKGNDTIMVQFSYVVSRTSNTEKMAETVAGGTSFELHPNTLERQQLLSMLRRDVGSDQRTRLDFLFPKFLRVRNPGDLTPAHELTSSVDSPYRNLFVGLKFDNESKWWEVHEACDDDFYEKILSHIPYADCQNSLVMYTFSDKLFPSTLNWLTAGGVIGIYTSLVFVAARFFRGMFSDSSFKIMFTELPLVDRILQLCLDIYLVRESLEFSLEEDLFAKLLFLYRSPEVMIRWTRLAEEQSSDEDDASDIDETESKKMLRKSSVWSSNK